jgi:hypothetical protein
MEERAKNLSVVISSVFQIRENYSFAAVGTSLIRAEFHRHRMHEKEHDYKVKETRYKTKSSHWPFRSLVLSKLGLKKEHMRRDDQEYA